MPIRLLTASDIRQALPMPQAIAAMKSAFADFSTGAARVPHRLALDSPSGVTLIKPAFSPRAPAGLGAKLVSVFPGNPAKGKPSVTGALLLLDPESGEPTALLNGAFLTAWRTGAASGAATELLARPESKLGAVFGAGAQARTQILAIDAARDLDLIQVFAPRPDKVRALIQALQDQTRAELRPASNAIEAMTGADVICTATNSHDPVFPGDMVAPGTLINGVGSFRSNMRELDRKLIARSRIVVDAHKSARKEAGELIAAINSEDTKPEDWTELGAIVAGLASGRQSPSDIIIFKSVGLAIQDIVAGAYVLQAAKDQDLGQVIDLED